MDRVQRLLVNTVSSDGFHPVTQSIARAERRFGYGECIPNYVLLHTVSLHPFSSVHLLLLSEDEYLCQKYIGP